MVGCDLGAVGGSNTVGRLSLLLQWVRIPCEAEIMKRGKSNLLVGAIILLVERVGYWEDDYFCIGANYSFVGPS